MISLILILNKKWNNYNKKIKFSRQKKKKKTKMKMKKYVKKLK